MRRVRGERGTATLELAIVVPALMLLLLGIVQFGLWYHAEHVTRTAALEAARTAAAEDGRVSASEERALEVLDAGLGSSVGDPTVRVTIGSETARVRISASMRGLLPIPGLSLLRLSADATAYRERFRPAGDGG
jgi:Flp pilus assembly protein TadG